MLACHWNTTTSPTRDLLSVCSYHRWYVQYHLCLPSRNDVSPALRYLFSPEIPPGIIVPKVRVTVEMWRDSRLDIDIQFTTAVGHHHPNQRACLWQIVAFSLGDVCPIRDSNTDGHVNWKTHACNRETLTVSQRVTRSVYHHHQAQTSKVPLFAVEVSR